MRTEYTDLEIIDALKNRENKVVQYITEKYLPMIVYMVEKMRGDRHSAEDIFQEALIIIITKIDKGEFVLKAKFSTYLYAVCKNLRLVQLRRQKVENKLFKPLDDNVLYDDYSDRYDKNLQRKLFWHYYNKLSDKCRKILRFYWLEMSTKEIAKSLDIKEKNVRKRKYLCKKKLVELIMINKDNV